MMAGLVPAIHVLVWGLSQDMSASDLLGSGGSNRKTLRRKVRTTVP